MDDDRKVSLMESFEISGVPSEGGVLIVADHASNHLPDDIDLAIAPEYLDDHIAFDPGTATIARLMSENSGYLAILSATSRLVVDLNRYPDEPAAIPLRSDGVAIPGNLISMEEREARMARFFQPYHDRIDALIADLKPALVLSSTSYVTPSLARPIASIGLLPSSPSGFRVNCISLFLSTSPSFHFTETNFLWSVKSENSLMTTTTV